MNIEDVINKSKIKDFTIVGRKIIVEDLRVDLNKSSLNLISKSNYDFYFKGLVVVPFFVNNIKSCGFFIVNFHNNEIIDYLPNITTESPTNSYAVRIQPYLCNCGAKLNLDLILGDKPLRLSSVTFKNVISSNLEVSNSVVEDATIEPRTIADSSASLIFTQFNNTVIENYSMLDIRFSSGDLNIQNIHKLSLNNQRSLKLDCKNINHLFLDDGSGIEKDSILEVETLHLLPFRNMDDIDIKIRCREVQYYGANSYLECLTFVNKCVTKFK